MPSFVQLLVIVVVALIVIVIWRMVRSGTARDENARRLSIQENERRTAQRRVGPERRQSIRPEPERRQGRGRRAEDQPD